MINKFLVDNNGSFLQSYEWGEFQEKLGRKIWGLGVVENDNIILHATMIKKPLPLGKSFLYIPFGPCIATQQAIQGLLDEIKNIAKAEGATYCYIEPFQDQPEFGGPQGSAFSRKPQKRIQPQQTLVIDLLPSEEQIFRSLKSKTTRYNIRFAEKKGVEFIAPETIGDKEIDIFYDLAQKSAQRDSFANYDKDYFKNLFSISSQDVKIRLFFAKFQDKYIAANIFVFFGKIAVHLFGGFDHDFRHLMAPYFMHWNQMLFAKNKMGCEVYDFWGIDEKKWPGVTHFKRSFGGKEITYPQGFDIVYNKFWYKTFKLARKIFKK